MRLARVDSPRIFKVGFSGQSNFYVSVIDDEDKDRYHRESKECWVHGRNINLLDILSGKCLFEFGVHEKIENPWERSVEEPYSRSNVGGWNIRLSETVI